MRRCRTWLPLVVAKCQKHQSSGQFALFTVYSNPQGQTEGVAMCSVGEGRQTRETVNECGFQFLNTSGELIISRRLQGSSQQKENRGFFQYLLDRVNYFSFNSSIVLSFTPNLTVQLHNPVPGNSEQSTLLTRNSLGEHENCHVLSLTMCF